MLRLLKRKKVKSWTVSQAELQAYHKLMADQEAVNQARETWWQEVRKKHRINEDTVTLNPETGQIRPGAE